jgi:D-threo-aldose 1-dehydrogenase
MVSPTDLRHVGSTGVRLSVLGVGTGSLANSGGADQFEAMIEAAWSGGLRHFDTAALYLNGESERRLGAAMQGKPREAYTLSTKAGRFASGSGSRFDYSRDSFMRSVETSLCRLQVDWLDIVMIHDLDPEHHGSGHAARMHEALDGACVALDMLRRRGVVRAIGVGSMNWLACLELVRRFSIDCVMLAGGYTLLRQQSGELLEYCRSHEISVMVASPFNSGILATGAVSDALYNYKPAAPRVLKRTRAIEAICRRHEVHIAAAALQFPLQHPAVTSVVAGHRAPEEITVNLQRLRCPIPAAFWSEIAAETAGLARHD